MAQIIGKQIFETDEKIIHELVERGFGQKINDKPGQLLLSKIEALYLLNKKKIEVKKGKTNLTFEMLLKLWEKNEKELSELLQIYTDLRSKNYIVRTGYNQESEAYFRVYEKGMRPGESHSTWLVKLIDEKELIKIKKISKEINIAHSLRKKILWAIIDPKDQITYYKLEKMSL